MLLGSWRRVWLAYDFQRDTGRYTRRLARLGVPLAISGFGATERTREHGKMFFCIYRWDGRLVFQAGTRSWPLDRPDLTLAYRLLDDRRSSELSVREGNEVVFRCSYRHWLRSLVARRPSDHDNIDFERDHFLAHVAGRSLPAQDFDGWEDGSAALLAARQTDLE
jgi:hypothetical protein